MTHSPQGISVVGVGASAGGLVALKQFFQHAPTDSGLAFVVIVHLSDQHESNLDSILQSHTTMPVLQLTETVRVERDHVYVIPPTKHLAMVDGEIVLTEREQTPGKRVPIDHFFRTLAEAYGVDAYAVVLSGSGSDGSLGIKRIKEEGGTVLVQDPKESEYDSMPRSAIATHLVDVILPVAEIPQKIVAIRDFDNPIPLEEQTEELTKEDAPSVLAEILTLLRNRTGHDFSTYKRPTLLRRIARRMQVHEQSTMTGYADFLREQPEEIESLLNEVLITVTNFFRDKEAFQSLEQNVIPRLFQGKTGNDTVRVWSCACATGEEAYSVAILLHEYAAHLPDPPSIQVFASDINLAAVRFGRDGRYNEAAISDISPERLRRFFLHAGQTYIIHKEIRESVLFAPHNVLRDPPFSQLDLIICRNLFIYLSRETQERVMQIFNFALRPGNYLFLGASEEGESGEPLFTAVDKQSRIYKSIRPLAHRPLPALQNRSKWDIRKLDAPSASPQPEPLSFGSFHHRAVESYAPPSILVNSESEIVHVSENAGRFLRVLPGEPSRDLLKTIDPSLQLDLQAALLTARQDQTQTEARNVAFKSAREDSSINIIVRPVNLPDLPPGYFLILFDDEKQSQPVSGTEAVFEALSGNEALESIVHRLENDLQQTRFRLRATIEQSETTVEELKASNEELQAINEELRSATEELETSKEELQAVNEELTTVNHELKEKVDEVSHINADLQNLMRATDIGTIFLDRNLCIKRYTPKIEELFNIISTDLGRPLSHITHSFEDIDFTTDARKVLQSLNIIERELRGGRDQGWYLLRFSPYRTLDDRIDGVVLSFVEITDLQKTTNSLREADRHKNEFLATLAHEIRNPLAPIRSGLEIMRGTDSIKSEEARKVIERQTAQIIHLVDDLLEISRISEGKFTLRKARIDLADALTSAIEASQPLLDGMMQNLRVSLPTEPLYLDADLTRLSQVFLNLLNNASKFTDARGQIWLTARRDGLYALVSVKDTGAGISRATLPHVFEMFAQAKTSASPQSGLGIGLSLVKKLVELHEGTASAFSEGEGQGSEFTVRLPLALDQHALQHPPPSRADSPRKKHRILVVDDNIDAANMLKILLSLDGHQVELAGDGHSGLEAAAKIQPDLVLLDIGLPDIDGYEVARRLREKISDIKLIAVSGWGQEEDRRRSKEAGFNHHLVKPVETEDLRRLLAEI